MTFTSPLMPMSLFVTRSASNIDVEKRDGISRRSVSLPAAVPRSSPTGSQLNSPGLGFPASKGRRTTTLRTRCEAIASCGRRAVSCELFDVSPSCDQQKLEILWILTHPLSSHVWRTSPVCSLEQHHRSHSITFVQCALEPRGSFEANSLLDIVITMISFSLAECSCEELHVCACSRRPHIKLHGSDLNGRQFTAR